MFLCMNDLVEVFRALSGPTRLRILSLLAVGDLCVGDIMEVLDLPQSTVSRHLSSLRRTRWVVGRISGRWMYYRRVEQGRPFLLRVQKVPHRELGLMGNVWGFENTGCTAA